jgi:GT2 family glycosyltransferase
MNCDVTIVLYRSDLSLVEDVLARLALQGEGVRRVWVLHSACVPTRCDLPSDWGDGAVAVEVACRPDNLGFAGGHNYLLEHAFSSGADTALVANPDLYIAPGALPAMLSSMSMTEARTPALHGPRLLLADRKDPAEVTSVDSAGIRWTKTRRHFDADQGHEPMPWAGPRKSLGVTGAALIVDRDSWQTIVERTGDFFDPLFIAYREDAELGIRIIELGGEIWVHPVNGFIHARGSVNGARTSPMQRLLGVQNRFLLKYRVGARVAGSSRLLAGVRDLVVVVAAFTLERESAAGFRRARALRRTMRYKARAGRVASSQHRCGRSEST